MRRFSGLLLNEKVRDEGSFVNENGRTIEFDRAYVITVLELGNKNGDIQKLTVDEAIENEVRSQLEGVAWGTLLDIQTNSDKHVVDVRIKLEWADDIPLD